MKQGLSNIASFLASLYSAGYRWHPGGDVGTVALAVMTGRDSNYRDRAYLSLNPARVNNQAGPEGRWNGAAGAVVVDELEAANDSRRRLSLPTRFDFNLAPIPTLPKPSASLLQSFHAKSMPDTKKTLKAAIIAEMASDGLVATRTRPGCNLTACGRANRVRPSTMAIEPIP